MSFRSPLLLWLLLLLVPFVLSHWVAHRRRNRARDTLGQSSTVDQMIVQPDRGRIARAILLTLGFALVFVALAGPRFGSRTTTLHRKGLDLVVALDFSKSMLAQDVTPSRIERAKVELVRFLEEEHGDRVGIVAFAGETMEFPLTVDYSAVSLFFRELSPHDMPVGGTAIGRALIAAARLLKRSAGPAPDIGTVTRDQVVILLTDGEDHEGDPLSAADALAEQGVRVYAIGLGSRSGEPIPVFASDGTQTGYLKDEDGETVVTALTAEAEDALGAIATRTGGSYFRADRATLGLDAIRREMLKLKRDEQQSRKITVHEPRFALLLIPALALLCLEPMIPIGRRRKRQ